MTKFKKKCSTSFKIGNFHKNAIFASKLIKRLDLCAKTAQTGYALLAKKYEQIKSPALFFTVAIPIIL